MASTSRGQRAAVSAVVASGAGGVVASVVEGVTEPKSNSSGLKLGNKSLSTSAKRYGVKRFYEIY